MRSYRNTKRLRPDARYLAVVALFLPRSVIQVHHNEVPDWSQIILSETACFAAGQRTVFEAWMSAAPDGGPDRAHSVGRADLVPVRKEEVHLGLKG